MVWVGRDLIDHLIPTPLPWAGTPWNNWTRLLKAPSTWHDERLQREEGFPLESGDDPSGQFWETICAAAAKQLRR